MSLVIRVYDSVRLYHPRSSPFLSSARALRVRVCLQILRVCNLYTCLGSFVYYAYTCVFARTRTWYRTVLVVSVALKITLYIIQDSTVVPPTAYRRLSASVRAKCLQRGCHGTPRAFRIADTTALRNFIALSRRYLLGPLGTVSKVARNLDKRIHDTMDGHDLYSESSVASVNSMQNLSVVWNFDPPLFLPNCSRSSPKLHTHDEVKKGTLLLSVRS